MIRTAEIIEAIDLTQVEGKAWVAHAHAMSDVEREAWLCHEDHFYVKDYSDMPVPDLASLRPLHLSRFHTCSSCSITHSFHLASVAESKNNGSKLQGLELFAGAGGLSAGMDQSGFIETQWAVEWVTSAALTYQYVLFFAV